MARSTTSISSLALNEPVMLAALPMQCRELRWGQEPHRSHLRRTFPSGRQTVLFPRRIASSLWGK
ncbi:hypothetical protein P154DRAFT_526352 [Amniculicola lignicola CBS 123094]|uniref:Uncharacterized protein n=1 Tax=Amniculicola lignicola CBS 123094 TaxID=1392246 RepID=A0A6A5W0H7_9PLEO|nr:hypothetical protein P154DRAFT_526352 [Amniculicola lignicola CBS 123094]